MAEVKPAAVTRGFAACDVSVTVLEGQLILIEVFQNLYLGMDPWSKILISVCFQHTSS